MPAPRLLLLALALLLAACSGSGGGRDSGGTTTRPVEGNALFTPFTGSRSVLLLPVSFTDAGPLFPATGEGLAQAEDVAQKMEDAFATDSRGTLALQVDVAWPPLELNKATTDYDPGSATVQLRTDAVRAARQAGYAVEDYDREVIFSAKVWDGSEALAWLSTAWMSHTNPWVLQHELGHTLNRPHANFWDGDPVGAGVAVEYGDPFDPMGSQRAFTEYQWSNPFFALRAAWLDDDEVRTVTRSGTYELEPLEVEGSPARPKVLRIRRTPTEEYWLFRRISEPDAAAGVVVLRVTPNPLQATLLLDMNRGSAGDEALDAALLPGQVFDDAAAAGIVVENVSLLADETRLLATLDEARQDALGQAPVIDFLSPAYDAWPDSSAVEVEVATNDPDAGPMDGDGIDHVELRVVQSVVDPPTVLLTRTLTEPPFAMTIDSIASGLPDGLYGLQVTAHSTDGDSSSSWLRFAVNNYAMGAALRTTAPPSEATLRIVDADGACVPGARVELAGGAHVALADADGRARFALPSLPDRLRVEGRAWAPGYLDSPFTTLLERGEGEVSLPESADLRVLGTGTATEVVLRETGDEGGASCGPAARILARAPLEGGTAWLDALPAGRTLVLEITDDAGAALMRRELTLDAGSTTLDLGR